jgi:hypothetical protein
LPDKEKHIYTETVTAPEGYLDGYITSVCKHCGDTKIVADQGNQHQVRPVDGIYTLTKPEHLMWYSANQNAGLLSGNETICLGADLDMKGFDYTPIATDKKAYTGKFDGCGYTIHNLTIEADREAGLFAKLGLGAKVMNLSVKSATVKTSGSAGAIAGVVTPGAIVKLENISVVDSTISSSAGVSGGIMGSSGSAVEVRMDCVVSDGVSVIGTSSAGIIGSGNYTLLYNAYANAKLTATSGKTGALATHSSSFTANDCGYSKSTTATQKDGTVYDDSAFASGEIAYMINTFGAVRMFGLSDGKTSISDTPVKMIRLGSKKVYTNNTLSAKNGTAVYTLPAEGGTILVIVQIRNAPERLIDSEITVDGQTLPFGGFTLSKYVACGDKYYVAAEGCIMYCMKIDVSSNPTAVIGSSFSGTAENVKN